MPKFIVDTSQGKFEVDIDKNDPTEADLQSVIQQTLNPPQPSLGKRIGRALVEEAPEIVGGALGEIGGGIAGAAVGRPLLGSTLGAGAGQSLGGTFKRAAERDPSSIERMITPGLPPPVQLGLTASRGLQSKEDVRKTAIDFAIGATGSLGGAAVAKVGNVALSPFKSALIENFGRLKNKFKTVGGTFTPGQASKESGLGTVIDFFEEFTEGSVTGSGPIRAFKETQQKQIIQLSEELSKSITNNLDNLGDDEIGDFVLGALKKGQEAHQAAATGLYTQVDEVLKAATVPTGKLKITANQFNIAPEKGQRLVLAPETKEVLSTINGLSDTLTFTEMHGIRSGLLKEIRDLETTAGKAKAAGQLKQIVKAVDSSMEDAAKTISPEAQKIWRSANTFVREGKEVFNNDLLTKILQKKTINPEKIGERVFSRGNITDVRKLKKAVLRAGELDSSVKSNDVWKGMQAGHLRQLLKPDTEGKIIGNKLIALFNDPKQLRTLKEIYSPDQLGALKELAEVAQLTQKRLNTGGNIAAKIMQIGAAGQLFFSPFQEEGSFTKTALSGGAGAILIGPFLFGRLATSPTGIKLLTEGFKANFTGRVPSTLFRALGSTLENIQENNSGKK